MHHKGLSYLHLEWVTKDELDNIDFKSNVLMNRFLKKVQESEQDQNDEILFVNSENLKVDCVLDCIDAIIEINSKLYLSGWRLLSPDECIPLNTKIYNLPKPWRERLGGDTNSSKDDSKKFVDELAGLNPYLKFDKDISHLIPENESNPIPDRDGSVYTYERIYLIKWVDMSIGDATWERFCDFNDDEKVQQFFDLCTIPPQLIDFYGDYLPENYITHYDKVSDLTVFEPSVATLPVQTKTETKKGKRGRPKARDVSASKRRNFHMRNCIDPIAPPFDRSIGLFVILICRRSKRTWVSTSSLRYVASCTQHCDGAE